MSKVIERSVVREDVINGETQHRADIIKDCFEFDAGTGVMSVKKDAKPFADTLPEGITVDTVQSVMNAIGDFAASAAVAFGERALDELEAHQNLGQITASIPLSGKDKLTLQMKREKRGIIPNSNEEYCNKGVLSSAVTLHGVSSKAGPIKKIASYFSEEAATRL